MFTILVVSWKKSIPPPENPTVLLICLGVRRDGQDKTSEVLQRWLSWLHWKKWRIRTVRKTAKIETRGKSLQRSLTKSRSYRKGWYHGFYLLYDDISGTIRFFPLNFTSRIPAKVMEHHVHRAKESHGKPSNGSKFFRRKLRSWTGRQVDRPRVKHGRKSHVTERSNIYVGWKMFFCP